MGFVSGAVSFRRYFMTGRRPKAVDDGFVDVLRRNSFGRSGVGGGDHMQVGWIGARHLFDTDITAEKISQGRYVQLAVRLDKVGVPAAVLRSYVRLEEEAARQAGGREFLNNAERRRAREQAQVRAAKEIRSGDFRRMSAAAVVIDLRSGTLLFGNLGAAANERLCELFRATFAGGLEPADSQHLAHRILGGTGGARALEHLTPFHLVRHPEPDDSGRKAMGREDLSFLGREFLTWLWHKSDADAVRLKLGGERVTMAIDKCMQLECDFGINGTVVITRSGPAASREARAALAVGKQPTRMGLIMGAGAGDFTFALDGPRMCVSGLVLPPDEHERDQFGRQERRFDKAFEAAAMLDGLFELFLYRRTAGDWSRDLKALVAWARRQEQGPVVHAATG